MCLSKSQRDRTFKYRLFIIKERIDGREKSNRKASLTIKERLKQRFELKKKEMIDLILGSRK